MTGMERYVRIPQLSDISLAVELYYSRIDLSNDDITDMRQARGEGISLIFLFNRRISQNRLTAADAENFYERRVLPLAFFMCGENIDQGSGQLQRSS